MGKNQALSNESIRVFPYLHALFQRPFHGSLTAGLPAPKRMKIACAGQRRPR